MNHKPDYMPMEVWDALQNMPDVELEPVESYIDSMVAYARERLEAREAAHHCDDIKLDQPLAGIIRDLQATREELEAEVKRLRSGNYAMLEALRAMLRHSCVADTASEDKDAEDHEAERMARRAIEASPPAPSPSTRR